MDNNNDFWGTYIHKLDKEKIIVKLLYSNKLFFNKPIKNNGCIVLLCMCGECVIKIGINDYLCKEGQFFIIHSSQYMQIVEENIKCRLWIAVFSHSITNAISAFSKDYLPCLFEDVIKQLSNKEVLLLNDYFKVLYKWIEFEKKL